MIFFQWINCTSSLVDMPSLAYVCLGMCACPQLYMSGAQYISMMGVCEYGYECAIEHKQRLVENLHFIH